MYHGKASRTTSLSDLSTPSPALDPIGRCRRRYKRMELAGVLCVREEVWKLPLQSTVDKANRGYFDLTIKVDVLKVQVLQLWDLFNETPGCQRSGCLEETGSRWEVPAESSAKLVLSVRSAILISCVLFLGERHLVIYRR